MVKAQVRPIDNADDMRMKFNNFLIKYNNNKSSYES